MDIPVETVIEKLAHKKFFIALAYDFLVAIYVDAPPLHKLICMAIVSLAAIGCQTYLDRHSNKGDTQ